MNESNPISRVPSGSSTTHTSRRKYEPYTLEWGVNRLQQILSIGTPFELDEDSRSKKVGGWVGRQFIALIGEDATRYAGRGICLLGMSVNVGCKVFGGLLALKFAGIISFPTAVVVSASTSSVLTAVNFYLISEKIGYEVAKNLLGVKNEEEFIEKSGVVKGRKAVFAVGLMIGILGGVIGAALGLTSGTIQGLILGAIGAFVAGSVMGGVVGELIGGNLIGGIGIGMIAAVELSSRSKTEEKPLEDLEEDPTPIATYWQKASEKPVMAISLQILQSTSQAAEAFYRGARSARSAVSSHTERFNQSIQTATARFCNALLSCRASETAKEI